MLDGWGGGEMRLSVIIVVGDVADGGCFGVH
jgi:hypothetical protein